MTRPTNDRAARSDPLAQIAQRVRTYDSKTDQTAQSDQHPENAGEFGALFGLELTSSHPKLTSGTVQRSNPALQGLNIPIASTRSRPTFGVPSP